MRSPIINELQNEVLTKSIYLYIRALYSRTKQAQAANNIRTTSVKNELLTTSVLEKGMKKLFHFKDGSISGKSDVENNMVTLLTESVNFLFLKLNSLLI